MPIEEMADGLGIVEPCQRVEQAGADVVGTNRFRGPEAMLRWLKLAAKRPTPPTDRSTLTGAGWLDGRGTGPFIRSLPTSDGRGTGARYAQRAADTSGLLSGCW